MRYVIALLIAAVLVYGALWAGAQINLSVTQPVSESPDFVRGTILDLCGFPVDARHTISGYELEDWHGDRCESLSELDECLLRCLSAAETVRQGQDCFDECVDR